MRALRVGVGALGELLVTAGALLLLFVVWQLYWTDVEANRNQTTTVQSLERDFTSESRAGVQSPTVTMSSPPPVRMGAAFAILRIPRFGAHYARPVLEGTDHDTLIKGVGHYIGTGQVGKLGNFAMAGHRTTYGRPFRDIDRLRRGDRIIVETASGYSVYAVARHEIVRPTNTSVIAPAPGHPGAAALEAYLTMTACHPQYSADRRYVVFAQLVRNYSRAEGVPASDLAVPTGGTA